MRHRRAKAPQLGLLIAWSAIASIRTPWAHNIIYHPPDEDLPNRVTVLGKFSFEIVAPVAINPTDPRYVTLDQDRVTLFLTALGDYRSYGLLAHNYLAGRNFDLIEDGDFVKLDFPDGREKWFHIYWILRAPKIGPDAPPDLGPDQMYAPPLDVMGAELTQRQAYEFIYSHDGYLVFQTCLGDQNGFLFVTGEPIARPYYLLTGFQKGATLPAAGGGATLLWSAPRPEDLGIYDN